MFHQIKPYRKIIQSVCYLFLLLVIFAFVDLSKNGDSSIVESLNGCKFDSPGEYRNALFAKKSVLYCINNNEFVERKDVLVNHMKLYSFKHNKQCVFASEFGSHVKIGYMKKEDITLINPYIIANANLTSQEKIECAVVINGNSNKYMYYETISIRYINEHLVDKEQTFSSLDACYIQLMLESF